jgi:hypothetical protein
MLQDDRRMVRTGSDPGDKTNQYVAAVAVSDGLSLAQPQEVEEQKLAPRMVIYPMEASEFMGPVKAWQQHMFPPDYEHLGSSVAQSCEIRASRVESELYNYEEALEVDAMVGKWIQIAQTAAMCSNPYVLEDGQELPKVPAPTRML